MTSAKTRREFLKWMGWTGGCVGLAGCLDADREPADPGPIETPYPRPNILWLSCEDTGPHLGCYGDPHAHTPTLDALAAQGVLYQNAFAVTGVCAPTRSSVITGLYPTTLGTHHMRAGGEGVDRSVMPKIPARIRAFPEFLRHAGYYCTNNAKQDYNFRAPEGTWDESSGRAHWKNRPNPNQPFFAVFNYTGTHEGSIRLDDAGHAERTARLTDDQRQDPDALPLPPYWPDTPVVRKQWAKYYELVTAMDYWVADRLRELDEAGLAEETIVFFWADHGPGLPRAKRWCYDSGTRIPLIVRIPARFRLGTQGIGGTVETELISSVDFAPTVLNLAGLPIPSTIQGRAFLGPNVPAKRRYVFQARDRMDERYDVIRAVRDTRYRYVRNYEPYKPYFQHVQTAEADPVMAELRRLHAAGQLAPEAEQFMADTKPIEELYDLTVDPHEVHNVAEDPRYAMILQKMRAAHVGWMLATRDLGLIPEPELVAGEERYGTRYDMGLALDREHRRRDLFYLASIAGRPNLTHVSRLTDALRHSDPAFRYWGAIGLGNLGAVAVPALQFLNVAAQDASPVVRVAAARALAKLGHTDEALEILTTELRGPQEWVRLHAAIVLDEMGSDARPAVDALRHALNDRDNKYVVRIANHALNTLLGTNHQVR